MGTLIGTALGLAVAFWPVTIVIVLCVLYHIGRKIEGN